MSEEIPRLSPSIAKHLLRAPSIAYQHHRLLGGVDTETTEDMRTGSILERFITRYGVGELGRIDAPDYRTKAAQESRKDCEAAGFIPVLESKYQEYRAAGEVLRAKITERVAGWADFEPQRRFEWQSGGVHCSGVLDGLLLGDSHYTILDLKKTASAHPKDIQRSVIRYGYDIQYGAYVDAVETEYPQLAGGGKFYFVFYESTPPYCVTVAELDGGMRILGTSKWERAKRIWRECMTSGYWPDYTDKIVRIEAKPYDLEELEETSEDELDKMF